MVRMLKPDGNRIKVLRIQRGWYPEQLAQRAYINPQIIRRIEAGGNATCETLRCIAIALDTDLHELIYEPQRKTLEMHRLREEWRGLLAAKFLPFMPALKGMLGSFALVLVVSLAIRLSPILVYLDAETGAVEAFEPAPPISLPAARLDKTPEPRQGPAVSKPSLTRVDKKTPEIQSLPATPVSVYAASIPAVITLHSQNHHAAASGRTPEAAAVTQKIAGLVDIEWLAGLIDPEPSGNVRHRAQSPDLAGAQKVAAPLAKPDSMPSISMGRDPARPNYNPVNRTLRKSGRITVAFLSKVGGSIKRVF